MSRLDRFRVYAAMLAWPAAAGAGFGLAFRRDDPGFALAGLIVATLAVNVLVPFSAPRDPSPSHTAGIAPASGQAGPAPSRCAKSEQAGK